MRPICYLPLVQQSDKADRFRSYPFICSSALPSLPSFIFLLSSPDLSSSLPSMRFTSQQLWPATVQTYPVFVLWFPPPKIQYVLSGQRTREGSWNFTGCVKDLNKTNGCWTLTTLLLLHKSLKVIHTTKPVRAISRLIQIGIVFYQFLFLQSKVTTPFSSGIHWIPEETQIKA